MTTRAEKMDGLRRQIAETNEDREIQLLIGGDEEDVVRDNPLPHEREARQDVRLERVLNGVNTAWLATIFNMRREAVLVALKDCPSIGNTVGRGKLYDIAVASAFLVRPRIDVEKVLASMKPRDLPAQLQPAIWEARLKRQKWEANAGKLWHSNDVLDVLSEAFKTIRETTQLFPDVLEKKSGLTESQRGTLIGLMDELLDELHQQLIEQAKTRKTFAQISSVDAPESEDQTVLEN